jgi:hypothetical protein
MYSTWLSPTRTLRRAVCGLDVLFANTRFGGTKGTCCSEVLFTNTRFAGTKGTCCPMAFDLCSAEVPKGDAGRLSL